MELFYQENPPITAQDIREFEANLGASLPEDYKAHLLTYNGGHSNSMDIYFGFPDDGINLFYFYPLKYGDSEQVEQHDYLPYKHISIGRFSTGDLAMSLLEDTYGHIYSYYSEVELNFLAPSFTAFVSGLIDYADDEE